MKHSAAINSTVTTDHGEINLRDNDIPQILGTYLHILFDHLPAYRALLTTAMLAAALLSPAVAAQISVTDDFGRTVTLPKPATRILSLGPHVTENLFSAGAGDKVVGVVEHSDYPPRAREIPSVGGNRADFNLEAALGLAPDLVVAWQTAANRADLDKLREWNIPVYYSEPRDFEDIIGNIEDLALLAGTGDRIEPPVASLRAELARVRARYGKRKTQKVFYQIWRDPLMTLNGEHYISRVLETCGARNVFADLPIIAPRVSVESVLAANPDIIIAGRGDGWSTDMSPWKKWRSLAAARRDAFVLVDARVMHRHTARMIMGIRPLCEEIDRLRRAREAAQNTPAKAHP